MINWPTESTHFSFRCLQQSRNTNERELNVSPAGEPCRVSFHVFGSDRLLQTAALRPSEPSLCPRHPVWIGHWCTHTHTLTNAHYGCTWLCLRSHCIFLLCRSTGQRRQLLPRKRCLVDTQKWSNGLQITTGSLQSSTSHRYICTCGTHANSTASK